MIIQIAEGASVGHAGMGYLRDMDDQLHIINVGEPYIRYK